MDRLLTVLAALTLRLQLAALWARPFLVMASLTGFFNALNRDVIGFALAEAAFAFALSRSLLHRKRVDRQ